MRKKKPVPFTQKFPNADPLALRLLERMLAFEPKDRPSAEEVAILLIILWFVIQFCVVYFPLVLEPSLKQMWNLERIKETCRKWNIM
jgi:hypothetical protein